MVIKDESLGSLIELERMNFYDKPGPTYVISFVA